MADRLGRHCVTSGLRLADKMVLESQCLLLVHTNNSCRPQQPCSCCPSTSCSSQFSSSVVMEGSVTMVTLPAREDSPIALDETRLAEIVPSQLQTVSLPLAPTSTIDKLSLCPESNLRMRSGSLAVASGESSWVMRQACDLQVAGEPEIRQLVNPDDSSDSDIGEVGMVASGSWAKGSQVTSEDPESIVLLLLEGGKIQGRGEWV